MEFKFKEKKTTAVITLKQIIIGQTPILFVSHNKDDGTWHFFTGHLFNPKDAVVVTLHDIVAKDESINQLSDMPPGWQASRNSITAEWLRVKVP
jgi:hypothetical protein